MNNPTPLEQAKALLGEHHRNYVIITQDDEEPTSYDVTFSDPYAARGLLDCANRYHEQYLMAGTEIETEWVWEDEDDGEVD